MGLMALIMQVLCSYQMSILFMSHVVEVYKLQLFFTRSLFPYTIPTFCPTDMIILCKIVHGKISLWYMLFGQNIKIVST